MSYTVSDLEIETYGEFRYINSRINRKYTVWSAAWIILIFPQNLKPSSRLFFTSLLLDDPLSDIIDCLPPLFYHEDGFFQIAEKSLRKRVTPHILQVVAPISTHQLTSCDVGSYQVRMKYQQRASEDHVAKHKKGENCEGTKFRAKRAVSLLVGVVPHRRVELNQCLLTTLAVKQARMVWVSRESQNLKWFFSPTQEPIQGQWWSNFLTHFPQ